jgi:predicted nucleotidyltransferase component of viral defense system
MMIPKEELQKTAKNKGYRPEMLEKVYRLLDLLEQFMGIPYLKDRLVLKGGTAINLFCIDTLPRLSIDLDFNYIGSANRETMQQEKVQLEAMIVDICQRRKYELDRSARAHAGGKMIFVYHSVLGNKGRLEIDLNYLFRIPLWDISWLNSPKWPRSIYTNVLDIHELAAGKLHALLGREASRDLFDSHQLLTKWPLDPQKLRLAFVTYAGMERDHWERISIDNIQFTVKDIRNKLVPVLRVSEAPANSLSAVES